MPIIGNGDIASAIIDRPDIIFFASGVSNSRCEDEDQYDRECALINEQNVKQHIVYFSSLCIYYSDSLYAIHKRYIERFISKMWQSYTIVRIGNIDWGTNPNTLINYLKAHPEADIQQVYRHILSKDEFQYWLAMIRPGTKDIMNIPGRRVWVPTLASDIREEMKAKEDACPVCGWPRDSQDHYEFCRKKSAMLWL